MISCLPVDIYQFSPRMTYIYSKTDHGGGKQQCVVDCNVPNCTTIEKVMGEEVFLMYFICLHSRKKVVLSFFESMVYFLKIQCQVCFLHIKLFLVENLFPPSAFSLWNMTTGIFVKIELWQNITSINMTIWRAKWLLASTSYIPSQVAPPKTKFGLET